MLFRRLILAAVAIGLVAGVLLGVGEQFTTAPLIEAAEQYEQPHHAEHVADGAAHTHAGSAWAPSDGFERVAFTILANICVAIGFALLLLVAMSMARSQHGAHFDWRRGLAWGGAAYATVFVAPSLGLPPEVPGTAAAALTSRQLWWLATVVVVGAALWIAVFAPRRYKWPAILLVPLPYLFGAPEPDGPLFAGHGPAAVEALEAIHGQFIVATAGTNLVLWLVLGLAGATAMQRWLVPVLVSGPAERAMARP